MRKTNGHEREMHTQEFGSSWPAVMAEILEYIVLTQLSLGRDRAAVIMVSLSRQRVAADQLQPYVDGLRASLAQQLPLARVEMVAGHHALHRVQIDYGN